MIGLRAFGNIESRSRGSKPGINEPFGGMIIYFFGDLQQLPPVLDHPIYTRAGKTRNSMRKSAFSTIQQWFKLNTCMRQNSEDQQHFRYPCDELAPGRLSTENDELLMS